MTIKGRHDRGDILNISPTTLHDSKFSWHTGIIEEKRREDMNVVRKVSWIERVKSQPDGQIGTAISKMKNQDKMEFMDERTRDFYKKHAGYKFPWDHGKIEFSRHRIIGVTNTNRARKRLKSRVEVPANYKEVLSYDKENSFGHCVLAF